MSKRKINQKDIAENLSLSVATVSKALRGDYSDINSETRARVVNMATQLGYMHGSSRRKAVGEDSASYMVGVLVLRKLHQQQYTSFFEGMSEKVARLNVSMALHYVSEDQCADVVKTDTQPPTLRNGALSGLILVNRWPEEIAVRLAARHPCVTIQHAYAQTPMDLVGFDESHGMDLLVEHLHRLGHRRIGFFGHCPQVDFARTRFSAYINALCRQGLEYVPADTVLLSAAHLQERELVLADTINIVAERIEQGVSSWICASDWVGYLLSRALTDRGYRIPQDVSITGFDDSENTTLGCAKLTSVSIPAPKIGAEALRRLIGRVRHPASPVLRVMLPCKLFEAQTTAPPRRH